MADGEPILYSLYVYAPNKGAPIFFIIAYGVSAVFHIWQCYRYKAYRLIGLHSLCAVLFTAGYALREYGAYNYKYIPDTTTKSPLMVFIMSQVFIYVCPPLLELSNYHVLGRIFYYVPYCSPLSPGRVLALFGALMGLIELLNSLGVAFASNPSSSSSKQLLGSHMTIAAVSMQLVVIMSFMCLAGLFHRRCAKANVLVKAVKSLLITLYVSMVLILIRCIYRLVEHAGHTNKDLDDMEALRGLSPILRYEVFFYVFEASLMLINSAIWNVWNPGRFLPRDYQVYLARDGNEVQGEKEDPDDDRSFLARLVNILTFGVLCCRKKATPGFEELDSYPTAGHMG